MKRNFGLDLYRSVAILMVLAAHSLGSFYTYWFNITPLEGSLGLGVEIFFALSGFLIGGILIRDVLESRQPTSPANKLMAFYLRRWMRTLPLYYLMVVVTIVYPGWLSGHVTAIDPQTLLANLFFLQNFQQQWLNFQSVSWSLSIEEWFYLLIPLGIVAISLVQQRKLRARLVLGYGLAVILLVLVYRTADFVITHSSWDFGTRKQIFQHLDAVMFGVLAAWLKYYHPGAYLRLARSPLFGLGALILASVTSYFLVYLPLANNSINSSLAAHSVCFTILGTCFAALVVTLDVRLETARHLPGWIAGIIRYISARSYGYYLIHIPILSTLSRIVQAGNLKQNCELNIIALAVTFIVAAVIYLAFEHPIMKLRDRIQFAQVAVSTGTNPPSAWHL